MYTMQDNIPSLMEVYADQAFHVILGGEEIPANLNYSISMGLGQASIISSPLENKPLKNLVIPPTGMA